MLSELSSDTPAPFTILRHSLGSYPIFAFSASGLKLTFSFSHTDFLTASEIQTFHNILGELPYVNINFNEFQKIIVSDKHSISCYFEEFENELIRIPDNTLAEMIQNKDLVIEQARSIDLHLKRHGRIQTQLENCIYEIRETNGMVEFLIPDFPEMEASSFFVDKLKVPPIFLSSGNQELEFQKINRVLSQALKIIVSLSKNGEDDLIKTNATKRLSMSKLSKLTSKILHQQNHHSFQSRGYSPENIRKILDKALKG
jgi:hypothetical protein